MKSKTLSTIDFVVTGETKLHCEGCEERVSKVLRQVSGVESVDANAETQDVKVAFDTRRVQPGEICATLQRMGYHVDTRSSDGAPERPETPSLPKQETVGRGSLSDTVAAKNEGVEVNEERRSGNGSGSRNPRLKERRFDVPALSDSTSDRSSSDPT